jgi:hypothetical protein
MVNLRHMFMTERSRVYMGNKHFTLSDRLQFGRLSIPEIAELKGKCITSIYADAKAGLLKIEKDGRRSNVRGPNAAAYLGVNTDTAA